MDVLALTALVLKLQGSPGAVGSVEVRAKLMSAMIVVESERFDLDPALVAAVIQHESGFRRDAVGLLGEQGLMQLKRGTWSTKGFDHLSDVGLRQPRVNIYLGVRHLAKVRKVCGENSSPLNWLSVYSGRKKCRPSEYSRSIMKLLA